MENLSFVAIDFEKLNEKQTSVCEVGMVRFDNGVKTAEFYSLIKPYGGLERNSFGKHNLKRIKDEMLVNAPTYQELFPKMRDFIGNSVVVCHNVSADINYIYNLQKELGLGDLYHSGYIDTMSITNATINLGGLPESYERVFGKPMEGHHTALADAMACAELLLALADKVDITNFLHKEGYIASKDRPVDYRTQFGTATISTDGIVYYDNDVDLCPSFWNGKTVVISGVDDKSGKRDAIKNFIQTCGGKCVGSLSQKTDILLTGGKVGPRKKTQTIELQQNGGKLMAISLEKFESVHQL